MVKNKFRFTFVAVLLILALVAAGCGSKGSNNGGNAPANNGGAAVEPHEFRMNLSSNPPSLDPGLAQDITSNTVLSGIFEGLTRKGENNEVLPGMAEKWEVSEDGLTYTFHIREGVKWTNGDPVTANDFEFAWKRVLDPNREPAPYAYQLYYLKNAEAYNTKNGVTDPAEVGVKATDEKTLVVTLNHPVPYFLSLMSFTTYLPVHQSVKDNEAWATDASTIISNGPFKMVEWEQNASIRLEANADYYDKDAIKLSAVNFVMVEDSATELGMYETDDLDWSGHPTGTIPTDQIEVLKASNPDDFHIDPNASLYYYSFNTTEKPFDNVKIRKALAMSIDRKLLTEKVTLGEQVPAYGIVPPGIHGLEGDYRSEVKDDYFTENVEEAKKLLAEGLKESGLTAMPKIDLIFNTSDTHKKVAEAIVEMWRTNLGVDVAISSQEFGVYLQNRKQLNFQIARAGWGADYSDPMTFIDLFTTKSGNNSTGYSSPEYDALVAKALVTVDPTERMNALKEAEAVIMKDMPIMPIYYSSSVYMTKPGFKGFKMDYKGDIDYIHGYYEAE